MKKHIGRFVALLPFISILALLVYLNWMLVILIFCGVILVFDIIGWIAWFWKLGETIAGGRLD